MRKEKKPTGVSRRILHTIKHMQSNDYEGALVDLFPAIDKTAKLRRPKEGVGKRIRAFFEDEAKLISIIATGNSIANIISDGTSISDALYKFGRTAIAHEGELDSRLEFNPNGTILIGPDKWNLPAGYIAGMCIAVIIANENQAESFDEQIAINVFNRRFLIEDLWGNDFELKSHICNMFGNKDLFS